MQFLLLTLGSLEILGLFTLIHASFSAPEGDEDERGFHLAHSEDGLHAGESAPMMLSKGDVLFFK